MTTQLPNKLKQYRALRQISFNQMAELRAFADRAVDDDRSALQFKIMYSQIDDILTEFKRNHQNAISIASTLEEASILDEEAVRTEFEFNRAYVYAIYNSLFETNSIISPSRSAPSTNKSNVKLPKVEIPKFSGDLKTFKSFLDMFTSLVHENHSLSKIEKFNYLLSLLQGPPLSLVQCTPMTADNYDTAFDSLVDRYDNKRLIAFTHLQCMDNAPVISNTKNAKSLRSLVDIFTENLAALNNLGLDTKSWDFLLFYMFSKHLDQETITRFEFEESPGNTTMPTFESLKNFVQKQANALETIEFSTIKKPGFNPKYEIKNKVSQISNFPKTRQTNTLFGNAGNCQFCNGDHEIYRCSAYQNKVPSERLNIVKANKWCTNCLSNQHAFKNCNSQSVCRYCSMKHHSTLHLRFNNPSETISNRRADNSMYATGAASSTNIRKESVEQPKNAVSKQTENILSEPSSFNAIDSGFTGLVSSSTNVLLSTAIVDILDSHGLYQRVRVLLDCGSQTSYITLKCFKRLGLQRFNYSLSIQGLGDMQEMTSLGAVTCKIKPFSKPLPWLTVDAVILEKLCPNMPSSFIDLNKNWSYLSNINLADPCFNRPASIDIILGAEIFPYILKDGRISSDNNMPVAVNTVFGYVVMGKLQSNQFGISPRISLFSSVTHNDISNLDNSIKRFWQIEEVPKSVFSSPDDELCEKYFVETKSRDSLGRYIVHLPFKRDFFGFDSASSRELAHRRFLFLEKRFVTNKNLHKLYCETIQEYLDNNYLELIPDSEIDQENCFYIPHHAVSKGDKIRIVYDASAKPEKCQSLNQSLLVGPKLQRDIFSIILNFRVGSIVFTCDIKDMFTQILVTQSQQDFQRMLWRFSPSESIKNYRLKRVTFGVTPSPYLANRVIIQLTEDEGKKHPIATKILQENLYIDDAAVSCTNLSEARIARQEIVNLLAKGGFEVRKFASNSAEFLSDLPKSHLRQNCFNFDSESQIKILGLQWDWSRDAFIYHTSSSAGQCTKRNILSDIARCFDPLGWMSPLTLVFKLIMQLLWTLGIEWDEIPPPNVIERWSQYKSELHLLSNFTLPRHFLSDNFLDCEIHGFCDASQKAYACAVYFRVLLPKNNYRTFFVAAKSKVAPLRTICIPRLELLAAVMLSDVMKIILTTLSNKIKFSKIVAWSDSSIALTWIRSLPYRWKMFISNRVAHIQENFSPNIWRHIKTHDNPADCASRGLLPSELMKFNLWWKGPPFLCLLNSEWPVEYRDNIFIENDSSEVLSEERQISLAAFMEENIFDHLLNKYSSLLKIQRIICYCLRFTHSGKRKPHIAKSQSFTINELHNALIFIVKHVQTLTFPDEINALKNKRLCSKPFRKLNVFLDESDLLRVGGRLSKSNLSYDRKYPLVLPKSHRLTTLIIEHFHKIYLHPGKQTLQFLILQHFWILSAKRAISSIVSKCLKCWRLNPKPYQPLMGNLPKLRISQIKAFSCVGVDYAGPFSIILSRHRGVITTKSYVCLFVCSATKALHLELASDLSTEAFLCAFRRFIARRGRCSNIFSDCGTNFVGAQKQIFSLFQHATESEGIEWRFHPPSAPHFSGLAEAGVKSVKTHLRRIIGEQVLTFEEFYTVLVQIEALLNSRPISPISNDPNDFSSLTPGHFLTLEPISALPDSDLSHLKLNHLSRWQLLQRLHQDFWSRWHLEYLHTLQQRGKWLEPNSLPVEPGTMVLIKGETTLPSKWLLGRISRLIPGTDGTPRVALVHTANGALKRPLVKLCPLPMHFSK